MAAHPQQSPQPQQGKPSAADQPPDHHLTWTAEHEARLVLVQRQLRIAQARWSEEQDLWIDEVTHLENLKRKCLKAGKKKKVGGGFASAGPVDGGGGGGGGGGGHARKGSGFGGMLKRGSWKGKKGSPTNESPVGSPEGRGEVDDREEEDEEEDEDEEVEGEDDTTETQTTPPSPSPRRPSISTLLKRTMSIGSKSAAAGSSSRRNTSDFGQPAVRPSLVESPVGSYSSGEGKGKGKGLSRRWSGR
ncbi:MAG: hypothetical protein Q9208_003441 [Pyrenodesmia sp. 3 TL-2023]